MDAAEETSQRADAMVWRAAWFAARGNHDELQITAKSPVLTGIEILGNEEERLEALTDQCDLPAFPDPVSRRAFVGSLAAAGAFAPILRSTAEATGNVNVAATGVRKGESQDSNGDTRMTDAIIEEKIRRARLSGPSIITADATVVEMDADAHLQVLSKGTNEWVCCPGNENIIGDVPMALDPMGMRWFLDLLAHKPKPTNTAPGLIYMLCGAYQHSYTDPFDRTSPPIPIGPHWMLLWPFDAKAAGLGTVMRDAGTMVMFAGTPYAHLHICGSPWDGNEYRPGDRVIRTLTYARP